MATLNNALSTLNSKFAESFTRFNHNLPASIRRYSTPLSVSLALLFVPLTVSFRRNYLAWRSLGDGGLPPNVIGWVVNWLLVPFTREQLSADIYDESAVIARNGTLAQASFIHGGLPQRQGEKPPVAPFVAPQRQLPVEVDLRLQKLTLDELESIAAVNSSLLRVSTSQLEGHGQALWLQSGVPISPWIKSVRGELAHIHSGSEGSLHVTLSVADAKEAVLKGWGQRHGLSGVVMPAGYLLIYAPRSEEEVKIVGELMRASARFATGGKEIR